MLSPRFQTAALRAAVESSGRIGQAMERLADRLTTDREYLVLRYGPDRLAELPPARQRRQDGFREDLHRYHPTQ